MFGLFHKFIWPFTLTVSPIPAPPEITKAPVEGEVDATLESTVELELINNPSGAANFLFVAGILYS